MPRNNLRGRIVAMFGTVKAFANAIGWSTRKAYDIVNGKQDLTMRDICELCDILKVDVPEDFRNLFLEQ